MYTNTMTGMDITNRTSFLDKDESASLVIVKTLSRVILIPISVFADVCCLYILYKANRLNVTTRLLISSLAISDLCVGTLGLAPLLWTASSRYWPESGQPVCGLYMFALQLFQYCGLNNILMLVLECYIAIIYPLRYSTMSTRKCTINALVIQWTFWLTWGITMYLVFCKDVIFDIHYDLCVLQHSTKKLMFVVIGAIFHIFLPVTVVIVMYTRILCIARQHVVRVSTRRHSLHTDRNMRRQKKRNKKALYSFLLVTISTAILWIPFTVIEMYETVTLHLLPSYVVWLGELMEFSIPWINVLILLFKHRTLRKTAAKVMANMCGDDGYMVSVRNVFIPNSLQSDTSSFRSANFLSPIPRVRQSESNF